MHIEVYVQALENGFYVQVHGEGRRHVHCADIPALQTLLAEVFAPKPQAQITPDEGGAD
jgi:hypothetical protein